MELVLERIFDPAALAVLGAVGGLGIVIAVVIGVAKGQNAGQVLRRAAETGLLCILGGTLARAFVALLLVAGDESRGSGFVVGWAFLLWPGIVDLIPFLLGESLLTTPENLLWVATGVGGFAALMDGVWRTHDWKGLGWLSFPLDLTWGLAGTTNAALLHVVNFAWGRHGSETRRGAHRYERGFAVKPGFAFTQGSVMSSLAKGPGDPLYSHERTHVWQSRIFGPFFVLSYLAWMAVWLFPGAVAGGVVRAGLFQGIEKWCYFNNPWEAWGYAVQGQPRSAFGFTPEQRRLIWPGVFVALWSIPFFGAVVVGGTLIALRLF